MKRRDFVKQSAVSGAWVTLGSPFLTSAQPERTWFDQPMRWAQLVLVENDPGNFDPDFWIKC